MKAIAQRFLLASSLLTLAALAQSKQEIEYVIPRDCIKSYELKDNAELRGPDLEHMKLSGIIVNYRSTCVMVRVKARQ